MLSLLKSSSLAREPSLTHRESSVPFSSRPLATRLGFAGSCAKNIHRGATPARRRLGALMDGPGDWCIVFLGLGRGGSFKKGGKVWRHLRYLVVDTEEYDVDRSLLRIAREEMWQFVSTEHAVTIDGVSGIGTEVLVLGSRANTGNDLLQVRHNPGCGPRGNPTFSFAASHEGYIGFHTGTRFKSLEISRAVDIWPAG